MARDSGTLLHLDYSWVTPRSFVTVSAYMIPFFGLTGTCSDDYDGHMIAAVLEDAPARVSMEPDRLDLTQIDFVPVIRAHLLAAGEKAGVRVLLSNPDGPALCRP